jgi:hypothetical protein
VRDCFALLLHQLLRGRTSWCESEASRVLGQYDGITSTWRKCRQNLCRAGTAHGKLPCRAGRPKLNTAACRHLQRLTSTARILGGAQHSIIEEKSSKFGIFADGGASYALQSPMHLTELRHVLADGAAFFSAQPGLAANAFPAASPPASPCWLWRLSAVPVPWPPPVAASPSSPVAPPLSTHPPPPPPAAHPRPLHPLPHPL